MKLFGSFLYLVAAILLLEVIKTVIGKLNINISFFLKAILLAVQFLICFGYVFLLLLGWLLRKYIKGKRKAIILLTGFIIFTGVAELIFSYWLYHPATLPLFLQQAYSVYYEKYERNVIQYDSQFSVYNPDLFYTLKPLTTGAFENAEFNTTVSANSFGLRDDEQSLQKPGIICLGDSYTMGWGVEQSETFPQQIEQKSGIKVLNASISSYGTARELIMLNKLDTTELKYLYIQYCGNDFIENLNYIGNDYKLTVSSRSYFDTLVSRQSFSQLYFPGKYFLLVSQIYVKQLTSRIYSLIKPVKPQSNIGSAEQAAAFLKVLYHSSINFKKVKVVVTLLDKYPFEKNNFLKQMEKLLRHPPYKNHFSDNLVLMDVSHVLSSEDYYILDAHLKPSGHLKVAEKLVEIIQKDRQGVALQENAN